MERQNNPAGRLLALIERGTPPDVSPEASIRDAWMKILDADDDAVLLRRLGMVYALPGAIRGQVLALDNVNQGLLLQELPKVEQALQLPLHGAKWQQFSQHVDATARYGLAHISDALSRSAAEPTVEYDRLDWLLEHVRELFDEVTHSDIDEALREVLARHVQAMEQAIQEVRIRGAAAIRDVVDGTVGAAFLYRAEHGEPTNEEGRNVWAKVLSVAAALRLLIGLGQDTLALGDSIYEALPVAEHHAMGETDDMSKG